MSSLRSVLVPLPPVQWGGLQAFAVNLNAGLRDAGWRWLVVVPPEAVNVRERLAETDVEVIPSPLARLRRSPWLTFKALAKLPGQIRELSSRADIARVSVVQAVGAHHLHGAMLAAKLRKPLVWQIHSSILPRPARRLIAPLILRRSHAIMTNGRQVAKAFWGRDTLDRRHFVFYAPVDPSRFAPNHAARIEARRQLNLEDECVVVGTVGNRVWQKNHGFLIKAAESLAELYPRLRFLILGEELQSQNGEYETEVEIPARDLNRSRFRFIQFVHPGRNVDRWIHAIDIFTLTSRAEGVPIALFEAMSAAKPVVSVDVGSIQEIIQDGRTGFLCQAGDLKTYTSKLKTLFANPSLRHSMGHDGRDRILSEFSMKRVVEAHANAYEAALKTFNERPN
jgi:glycosyltransferase involved in cell wall biosynthesis